MYRLRLFLFQPGFQRVQEDVGLDRFLEYSVEPERGMIGIGCERVAHGAEHVNGRCFAKRLDFLHEVCSGIDFFHHEVYDDHVRFDFLVFLEACFRAFGGFNDVTGAFDDNAERVDKVRIIIDTEYYICLLYTSPSPRDRTRSRMPSSA